MDTIKRETFRNRLLKYFGLIIIILTLSSGFTLFQAFRTNHQSDIMFRKLFITSSLTIKMGTVHQNLKNYINYENEELLPTFLKSLEDMVYSFDLAKKEIIGDTITTENQSLYYKFIDIQKMVTDYSNSSQSLVNKADFANRKFNIFDSFYELEKLKDFIYLSQTDLIFRQMVLMETFFNNNRELNNKTFLLLLIFTVVLILLSILAAFRFSNTLTGPIRQLVSQAENVSQGIFEPIQFTIKTSSELFILINAFNQMVGEIRKQIEELKQKASVEKKLIKEELKSLKMENSLNQSELLFLQSQMNPHFLFNTINIISAIADIEEAEQTREMLDNMSVILHYNLKYTGINTVLSEEVNVIENYLSIQKKRFGERIRFFTEIDQECLNWIIPSMIIQPLVENSVIHGLEPKEDPGSLTLKIRKEGESVVIIISDNGIGISRDILKQFEDREMVSVIENRKHLGIKNVIRRMDLCYHQKCITFSSIINIGTEVRIRLPFSLS